MRRWAVSLIVIVLAGCGDSGGSNTTPPPEAEFDAARAIHDVRVQVGIGPRPEGTAASEQEVRFIALSLRQAGVGGVRIQHPYRNVVARIPGAEPGAIVLGAHHDTKDIPGFVGANDGAGGTAAVLELARALRHTNRPAGAPELRFVLFDGEEAPDDKADFYRTGLRGSKAYARRHRGELRALVLLDFVAGKQLRIPREDGSDIELWARLRRAAKRVGVGAAFPDDPIGEILDDHTPFTRAGVPAIDLIDFDFPCWHKTCDDMSAVSARSLDISGEAVLELLRSWR
jgi:Zn-dependent M28 family amino/carboxypeptidase